jgi:F-type H+-transporting ATPase subunit b
MRIDWLTVVAQIVNFLLLVWLLKRFLYQPVMEAMARREARIESRLEEARTREAEAEAEAEAYRAKSMTLEQEREQQLEKAREAAHGEERRLVEKARHDVDQLRDRWIGQLRREQDDFRKGLKSELAAAVADAARSALSDLADSSLEQRVVEVLLQRMEALPDEEREALLASPEPLRVTSAFELGEASREHLRRGLDAPGGLDFSVDRGLGFGIVIRAPDYKLEWTAASYLDNLEERLGELLAAPASEDTAEA